MGAAIKKCTPDLIKKLEQIGYVDSTWPRYKNVPMEECSLCTYAWVFNGKDVDDGSYYSEEWFKFFKVPTSVCFSDDPRMNWVENRKVFDNEDDFINFAENEKKEFESWKTTTKKKN